MKQFLLSLLLTVFMSIAGTIVTYSDNYYGHDIAVDNEDGVTIYYNYINDGKELEVTFKEGHLRSSDNAFFHYGYEGVKTLRIPETVTYMNRTRKVTRIGARAFQYAYLSSVIIPNTVTSIADHAFYDCIYMESVNIPSSVTSIGAEAFYQKGYQYFKAVYISDLTAWCNIDFKDNPLTYAHHLYLNGEEIKKLVIPNSVTSIPRYAFDGCSGLTSVTIPNSVIAIGNYAFRDCSGLTNANIPNSVSSIGDWVFSGCKRLTSVTIPNTVTCIPHCAFSRCEALSSVTIPNSVTIIDNQAFGFCTSLTSVTIPSSVTSIGANAFCGIDNLLEVVSLITEPFNIYKSVFSQNTFFNATLRVPVGTTEKYKSTGGWDNFVWIEEDASLGINSSVVNKNLDNNRFTIDGKQILQNNKGINILKMPDGTMRKVVVK